MISFCVANVILQVLLVQVESVWGAERASIHQIMSHLTIKMT